MAKAVYTAEHLEVLDGLDPVKRRPGMYTDTTRPNHLAQEVIDNSVDEALGGFATRVHVVLHKDGSLSAEDDGRGIPVDMHPEEKITGVELVLTRLHAGGKFSQKNYEYSGGLHGVGVSVVNALSSRLEVEVKRNGELYHMSFVSGDRASDLKVIKSLPKKETGTKIHFWPDAKYFDSVKFSASRLKHILKAKAVLCSGLTIQFDNEITGESETWCYHEGLGEYLSMQYTNVENILPSPPFTGQLAAAKEAAEWAVFWVNDSTTELVTESYVNLIPTTQGGTHVNGFRMGLLEALREFCEFRNLLQRGVKLAPEDVWEACAYVLSVKMQEPQFSGQTKERLSSRECATFVQGVVKDAFSLWLNQHVQEGEQIAALIIERAQKRLRKAQAVTRKKTVGGPALPGKLADCSSSDPEQTELFLVEGDSAGGSAKLARDRQFQAILALRGKILNTWEVDSNTVLSSQEIHDIAVAIGLDPGSHDLSQLRYGKVCILADADSDGAHIATLICALFLKHFPALVKGGHVFVAMPPLYRIDAGKTVYYALDDSEKQGVLDRIAAEKKNVRVNIQRFKGLGEMNPKQLRETTMATTTRRLVQLTMEDDVDTQRLMDMLLSKKRASDRKRWLETKGDLADV